MKPFDEWVMQPIMPLNQPSKKLSPSAEDEQRAFENWAERNSPSGDCDSVHYQWLESSDYLDLVEDQ